MTPRQKHLLILKAKKHVKERLAFCKLERGRLDRLVDSVPLSKEDWGMCRLALMIVQELLQIEVCEESQSYDPQEACAKN